MEQMLPGKKLLNLAILIVGVVMLSGCRSQKESAGTQTQHLSAKELFEQTSSLVPSVEAKGPDKAKLQAQAIAGYSNLLKQFPEDIVYAPQAERSLGNLYATQGRVEEAVTHFEAVGTKYPNQEWEVLMAWKSAGDLLWENGRKDEGKKFYRMIVNRFDRNEVPAVTKTVVKGSKLRLAGGDLPADS